MLQVTFTASLGTSIVNIEVSQTSCLLAIRPGVRTLSSIQVIEIMKQLVITHVT